MSSVFPQSAIGLPVSLKYDLPPSLSDSARSYSVNVGPDSTSAVTGPAPPAMSVLFPSTTASVLPFGSFNSQVVSFTIPSGMSDSVFMDTNNTTLSFSLTYSVSSTTSGGTNSNLQLIGGGHSFWDQLVVYSNNVPIETINNYGLLQNFLLNNTVSSAERNGGISVAMGCDSNSNNGIELAFTGNTGDVFRYNFCIPLCSVLGYNTDKLFPVGSINNLMLQMTTATLFPAIAIQVATASAGAGQLSAFTLGDFQLNMKYIDIGDLGASLLKQTLQDGKWFIKSTTYTNSAVNIPAGSAGNQQLLLQIRNSSVKSILHQFGISNNVSAQALLCPNGYYDAFNPCLTSRQCQVGGNFYPNRPINDCKSPGDGYQYLIQSLGGSIPKALGTVVNRDAYNVVIDNIPAGSDTAVVKAGSYARGATKDGDGGAKIFKYPNMFYCGYDLEKSAGILFQGVNTRASPPFLNLYLGTANTYSIICQAFGMSDVILSIDTVAKQIQAFI